MASDLEEEPTSAFFLRAPQKPLSLRFEHAPFWPDIRAVLGGTETLAAVALDLVNHNDWVSYSRTFPHYARPSRYRNRLYTFRLVKGAMDHLDALGLIDHDCQKPGQRGWQSAARAGADLRALISGLMDGTVLTLARRRESVVLRNKDRMLIDYADDRQTHRMRKNLDAINEAIGSAGLPPPLNSPVARIFNRNFRRGGRFYAAGGAWQILSKEDRATIRIDGEPVVELDFRALHPMLLYAEAGLPMPADAYDLPPWPRELVKLVLLVLINAQTRARAQGAIANHERMSVLATPGTKEAHATAARLIEDVSAMHHGVSHAFGDDAGARLMRLDADIAEAVMLDLHKRGIVVLPVHDSFLAPASRRNELERAMTEAAERITGTKLAVA